MTRQHLQVMRDLFRAIARMQSLAEREALQALDTLAEKWRRRSERVELPPCPEPPESEPEESFVRVATFKRSATLIGIAPFPLSRPSKRQQRDDESVARRLRGP